MLSMKRIGMALAVCLGAPQAAGAVTHDVSMAGIGLKAEKQTIELGESLYHSSAHSEPGRDSFTSLNGRINVLAQYANEPPIADFSSSCVELTCNFTDQSIDTDGSIASWSWAFGDGGTSTSSSPSHSYAAAGTYSVTVTVTDDDGASHSQTRTVVVTTAPAGFLINAAITDAWFSPLTDGQGFFIIVWEESGLVFLSWFTYDSERPPQDVTAILGEPGHRWLTAQGPYSGDTATLDVYLTSGGVFDAANPAPATGTPIGTITIVWTGCNSGTLDYGLPSLGLSGAIDIERIVLDKVPACAAAQP